jgi:(S)-2-hydroxyglutarate dehydrogenase
MPGVHPPSPQDPSGDCDLAVVGAGILGLAVARELLLRHPELSVRVLEKEDEVGAHQTGHNSGVIHAGIYYAPGSLKARLCVQGARALYEYCEANGVRAERCGKLIVAVDRSELPRLDELERRGRANGVPGLRRLGAEEIAELEPHARGVAALHSPATGVVDFRAVARALATELSERGGMVATGCGVADVRAAGSRLVLAHERGETRARHVVFCGGLRSDRLAIAAGAPEDPRIVPFRGSYLRLVPERRALVRALIYPVPDPKLPFLGVHLSRHPDGEVHIGPTALLSPTPRALAWPGTYRMMRRFWRTGVGELRHAIRPRTLVADARRYVPELTPADVLPGPAGVRAQALARDGTLHDDFVFSRTERALHVRNAPSPAATSALAIARMVAGEVEPELG